MRSNKSKLGICVLNLGIHDVNFEIQENPLLLDQSEKSVTCCPYGALLKDGSSLEELQSVDH